MNDKRRTNFEATATGNIFGKVLRIEANAAQQYGFEAEAAEDKAGILFRSCVYFKEPFLAAPGDLESGHFLINAFCREEDGIVYLMGHTQDKKRFFADQEREPELLNLP